MAINPLMFIRGESPRLGDGWTPPTPPDPPAATGAGRDYYYQWQNKKRDRQKRKGRR
jgi:hypothetical protein